MLAPPCSSFSPARDRTRVIRTRQHPWGLQGLPAHEVAKVKLGNQCFRSAVKIIRWLDEAGIPWILENPHSSKCWYLPRLIKLMKAPHVLVSVCVTFVSMARSGGSVPDSFQETWMSATLVEFNAVVMVSQGGAHGQGIGIFNLLVLTGMVYLGQRHTLLSYVITWHMHSRPIDVVFLTKVSCRKASATKQFQTTLSPLLFFLCCWFTLLIWVTRVIFSLSTSGHTK